MRAHRILCLRSIASETVFRCQNERKNVGYSDETNMPCTDVLLRFDVVIDHL
jgi:hypothetical protein